VPSATTPFERYTERAARFAAERDQEAARWSRIANLRLLAALAVALALGIGLWRGIPALAWLAAPLAVAFLTLVAYHNRLRARRDRFAALHELSLHGLARLRRDWQAMPLRQPAAQAGPSDPSTLATAGDLDLLGTASLQHLMGTARTPAGLAAVQRWLLHPAPPHEIRARQEAVAELAPQLDLRDEVAVLASLAGESQARYEAFAAWAAGEPALLRQRALLWLTRISPLALVLGVMAQAAGLTPLPLWGPFLLLNMLLTALFGWRSQETLAQLYDRGELLAAYAAIFERLATAPAGSAELQRLQAAFGEGAGRADRQLRRLSLIAAGAELSRSLLYPALQFGLLWSFQFVALAEGWRRESGRRLQPWLATLGDWEALAALAALAHDHPSWAFPSVAAHAAPRLSAHSLGHPLLPPERCVTNDVSVGPPGSFLLITGSNMSGKSTLLRAIGVNAALAQAGGPVCAAELLMPPLTLATSMRVQDSLAQGVSYFMAELRRLKAIVDLAESARAAGGPLVLYLLDEILQGTNSAERLVAARRVISHLVICGAIGAVSTHDLVLADAAELADVAQLAHFSEQFVAGEGGPEMRFDYQLRPGLAVTTNALKLMALVGLPTGDEVPAELHAPT
jgi:ABC-type multidrug transport system fused ATPase/permease subunit